MRLSVLDQSTVAEGIPAARALHNSVDLAVLAEQLGYHRYWVAEHHGLPSHASTAPEILLTRIAAQTSDIRVGSGGVLLPYYSPMKVVEVFRMIEALFPGRIDLGLGRSAGANPVEYWALRRDLRPGSVPDDFDEKLAELLAFLHDDLPPHDPRREILVMPAGVPAPPVWLLGSSPNSAVQAARAGLPYAYAHFINPTTTRVAVEAFREGAARSGSPRPPLIVGVGVYCADTEAKAQRLLASHLVIRQRLFAGAPIRGIPDADEAVRELARSSHPLAGETNEFPRYIAGTPEQVHAVLTDMAAKLGVDEFIAMNMIYDHDERRRCYELLAQAFALTPRSEPVPSLAG
jgi:luciferase family oxidoreductase group 1